jgi:hypothetical protein
MFLILHFINKKAMLPSSAFRVCLVAVTVTEGSTSTKKLNLCNTLSKNSEISSTALVLIREDPDCYVLMQH